MAKPKITIKHYETFLKNHSVKDKGNIHNFTRIGDTSLNIYGGKYYIPDEDLSEFYKLYKNYVFTNKKNEYLTEVQLEDGNGPILIDLDFRYERNVNTRQHDKDDILNIVDCYLKNLKKIFTFTSDVEFPIFIFEKDNVNQLEDKTKDGIHIIIGLKLKYDYQMELRNMVVNDIQTYDIELPLINDWSNVIDISIPRGKTNWQLFGSKKPGNQGYKLKDVYVINYDENDNEFGVEEKPNYDYLVNFNTLCAHYSKHHQFGIQQNFIDSLKNTPATTKRRNKLKIKNAVEENHSLGDIKNEDDIDSLLKIMFDEKEEVWADGKGHISIFRKSNTCYNLKEIYDMLMILPSEYYTDYDKWIRVGWALKNTADKMFLCFIKFSAQWKDFNYSDIPKLYDDWSNYDTGDECLSSASILYWAKEHWITYCEENPEVENEYETKHKNTLDYYIENTVYETNDYNFAVLLQVLLNNTVVCASIRNKTWFVIKKNEHVWRETDTGHVISNVISTDMYNLYCDKILPLVQEIKTITSEDPDWERKSQAITTLKGINNRLKDTAKKDRIKKEVADLLFDEEFYKNLDNDPYKLGCKNGIIDFESKSFRQGYAKDYISKSTGLNYITPDKWDREIVSEIETFMSQLFPNESLRQYIWDTLASILIGTNKNQTFNNFYGGGSNGKSKLVDFMKIILGDYAAVIPTSYLTSKRNQVGTASPELAALKGIRFGLINEPTAEDKLNDGKLKEITGGDEMIGRALFKEPVTFKPQLKVFVCTNNLFEINDRTEGLWRRIRIVPFESKFVRKINENDKHLKHQFLIDDNLDKKMEKWKETFLSMLVQIVFKTDGVVKDVDVVMEESNKYRMSQDHLMDFIQNRIVDDNEPDVYMSKGAIKNEYDVYCQQNNIMKKQKINVVFEEVTKRYGVYTRLGWRGIKMVQDNYEDE